MSNEYSGLVLSKEEMKDFGYRVVDLLVEHFVSVNEKPAIRKMERDLLEKNLIEDAPEEGGSYIDLLSQLKENVFENMFHTDHPSNFAFVPGPNNFVSVMGDALSSGFNVHAATWLGSSGAAQIELTTIDWLKKVCSFPEKAGGLFVSGGSMANLTALATARKVILHNDMKNAIIYFSDQTHFSNEKAIKLLGFQENQCCKIASDSTFRLDVKVLQEKIDLDRKNGKRPFCVIGNAGTTNTGTVDPLLAIANICRKENLWFHVDGVYGASTLLCKRGKEALQGVECADSLSLDPHKWLFQPQEIGCVLVKDATHLQNTFHYLPEYLSDTKTTKRETNFCNHGFQLTRSFRALKLWMSLKVFGLKEFRTAIEHGFHISEYAEKIIKESPALELITPAQLGIITFRYSPKNFSEEKTHTINEKIMEKVVNEGCSMMSSTILKGKKVMRLCTINPRTKKTDIEKLLLKINTSGRELL